MLWATIFALLALGLPLLPAASPLSKGGSSKGPVVNLGYARYEGTTLDNGVNQFLGIRYAAPPLGDLRFRAAEDPPVTKGIQDAKEFGAICVGTGQTLSNNTNEDCLFVDVFAPANPSAHKKLPVWFFIQGGGYAYNSDNNFNGTDVVVKSNYSMIFVQINYRVGAFGFLASEKVRENGDLNVGLLDQEKALKWARKYIHHFGGDPDHIVIHGTSAGAGSVAYHLTAYGGKKEQLFVGAIAESPFFPAHRTVAESESQFEKFVQGAKCAGHHDPLACLRAQDSATLQAADVASPFPGANQNPLWYYLPVIDGTFAPAELYTLLEQGRVRKVPVLVGDDNDEGTYFAPNASTSAEFLDFMKANYPRLSPADLQLINATYPPGALMPDHSSYFPPAAQAYGESTFTCPGNEMASSIAKYVSPSQAWNYRYNVWDASTADAGLGVPHVIEKPAVWGPGYAGPCDNCSYVTYNKPIVPIVMDYWISFILSLNPNTYKASSAPEWKPWGHSGGQRMRFQLNATDMEVIPDDQKHRCQIWKGLAGTMQQ